MIVIYPYKPFSKSAKALALAVGGKRIYYGIGYKYKPNDLIINWGNSHIPTWGKIILNQPCDIIKAQNKLTTLKYLQATEVSHPEFTTNAGLAKDWINNGYIVLGRTLLRASGGSGISLLSSVENFIPALVYVKYIPKKSEFRVHVFKGEVVDVQQKRRKVGAKKKEGYSSQIRNHANGWVFCREGIVEPEGLRSLAIAAVNSLSLDFGAVDIIYNEKQNKCYVLEVNTAPGLEGSTVNSYAEAIKKCS